ncbi:MAG: hypothetical protein WKF70_14555 [Chitinophagaceae bacterium]
MDTGKQSFFKETQQLAEAYIKERLLLAKLQIAEKAATMAAVVFAGAFIAAFCLIILLLISAIASYFLANITGSWLYGLGIVVLFYIILVAVLIHFRKVLFYRYVSNAVIKLFFKETDSNDEGNQA